MYFTGRIPWTGVLAPGLSKRNILDALAKRHVYSTLDRNCKLTFQINGATMGDIIVEPVTKVKVRVVVDDVDDTTTKIELFEDGTVINTHEPNAAECWWEPACSPEPGQHYYFAKVTQADGNLLWSAPIWLTVAEQLSE